MTEIRSIAGAQTYLARETVAGTAETTGFFGVPGIRMRPGFDGESNVIRGGSGKAVTSVNLTDLKGEWDVSDFGACFNHLGVPAASVLSLPVTTTPGGGTNSRQHVFSKSPTSEDTKRTYTAIWGDGYYGFRGAYGYFNSLGLDIQRGELSFDTSFRSRRPQTNYIAPVSEVQTLTVNGVPTSGNFTLQLPFVTGSPTTAGIIFSANAATVEAALVALTGVEPTDVTVTGGPLLTGPFTVTWQGQYAQENLALMIAADTFDTGGVDVAQVTAGAVPTDMVQAPMPSNMWDIYIDDSWANLGNTHYGGAYAFNPSFGDKFDEDAPINSQIDSYEAAIEKEEQDDTFDLTLRLGATALSLIESFNIGEKVFLRAELSTANATAIANGVDYYIEGSIPWSATLDLAVILTSIGNVETAPNSSVITLPLSGVIAKDDANMAELTLVNTVLTY
jgi:hypothetical protein